MKINGSLQHPVRPGAPASGLIIVQGHVAMDLIAKTTTKAKVKNR